MYSESCMWTCADSYPGRSMSNRLSSAVRLQWIVCVCYVCCVCIHSQRILRVDELSRITVEEIGRIKEGTLSRFGQGRCPEGPLSTVGVQLYSLVSSGMLLNRLHNIRQKGHTSAPKPLQMSRYEGRQHLSRTYQVASYYILPWATCIPLYRAIARLSALAGMGDNTHQFLIHSMLI